MKEDFLMNEKRKRGKYVLPLSGKWRLDYFPQPDAGPVRNIPLHLPHDTVEAAVPGNCELDLVNAGVIPDPRTGLNALKLRPYEGYQWLYSKTFTAPEISQGERAEIVFNGIDTLADIFLNGEKIGESANMLIPHVFDVSGKILPCAENTVQVLLRSVSIESQFETLGELGWSMIGGADGESFRKAAHMGGWDIFPRVFASGLWRSAELRISGTVSVDQPDWIVKSVDTVRKSASVIARCRIRAPFKYIDKAGIRFSLSKDGVFAMRKEIPLRHYHESVSAELNDVSFWWPAGSGEPFLYDGLIEVLDEDGSVLAEVSEKIGIRTVELEQEDVRGPDHPGQFLFRVNGRPVYIRGTNWVPLDAFHGRDGLHLASALEMLRDLNCNMVRVWGGGVYESDGFYDWCDRNGVLVWQDFMTGCSVFPQNDRYAEQTREEILSVVLRLRNHPSIALWSGNNENDSAFEWQLGPLSRNPNSDRNSRRTIRDVLYEFDVTRPYLPSSPYRSPEVFSGIAQPSEDHLWGPRGYYKTPYYMESPCLFVSEMGYHGCPNRASIEKMMTPESVYPWTDERFSWNDEWRFKAVEPFFDRESPLWDRNDLMIRQIEMLFGEVPRDLDDFIDASQIVQAEAMKTFAELFRSRKFKRCNGLIWWNLRDGWPIISDAAVDYYGGKKRAYFAIRNAQRNQLVMIRDDHRAVAVNDSPYPVEGRAVFTDFVSGEKLLEIKYSVAENDTAELGDIPFEGRGVIRIDYGAGDKIQRNHYLYGTPPFKFEEVREWMNGVCE